MLIIGGILIFIGGIFASIWIGSILEKRGIVKDETSVIALSALVLILVLVGYAWWGYKYSQYQSEKSDWQDTTRNGTIQTYLDFLDKYPQGHFTENARNKLMQLFESNRNIHIQVSQSFEEGECAPLPFVEDVAKFCEALGIRNVHVRIRAEWKALGASYRERGYLYTGARLTGFTHLEDTESAQTLRHFDHSWEIEPSSSVYLSEIAPGSSLCDAPYRGLYRDWHYLFVQTLGEIYGADALVLALEHKDFDISFVAASALAKLYRDQRALNVLICSRSASEEIAHIGKPAVKPLISVLNDESKDVRVRAEAANALGKIRDPLSVEPLISALKKDDYDLRKNAAWALGEIKDVRAIESLIGALSDKHYGDDVRENAAKALEKITGINFGQNYEQWQMWWKLNSKTFLKNR